MTDDENHAGLATLVTTESRKHVNPRQQASLREHRRKQARWMLNLGKNPEKADGYAESTVKTRMARLDKFYRWVWNEEGGYTEDITVAHADAWMKHLCPPGLHLQLQDLLPESRQNPVQMAKPRTGKGRRLGPRHHLQRRLRHRQPTGLPQPRRTHTDP